MGDLLAAIPVVEAELASDRSVALIVFPQILPFLELLDFAGSRRPAVVTLPIRNGPTALLPLLRRLGELAPDLVLISPHAPRQAASRKVPLVLWFAQQLFWRRCQLIGAADEPFSQLFDTRIEIDRDAPLAQREWQLYVGLRHPNMPAPTPRFKSELYRGRINPPIYDLMIHPGAGASNRKWPASHYAALLRALPNDWKVAVIGLPIDLETIKGVAPADRRMEFFSGSLAHSIELLGSARVVLTMDSGSMFFAQMLGVPTVALFGPSAPQYVIPQGTKVRPILQQAAPCQPCRSTACRQPSVLCMEAITPETVLQELRETWKATATSDQ